MKKLLSVCCLLACLLPFHALAIERATPEEAVTLVKQAVDYLKKHGKQKAFAAFNDSNGEFVKGELYIFVYGTNGEGIVLAHGQNPQMVGTRLAAMKDANGVYIIKEAVKIANSPAGKGWFNYLWPNSVSKKVETKRSYVERVDDVLIGCGIYH